MVRYLMTVFYTFVLLIQLIELGSPELFLVIGALIAIAVYQEIQERKGRI